MNRTLARTVALPVLAALTLALPASAHAEGRILGGDKVPAATYASTYSSTVSVQRSDATYTVRGRRRAVPDSQAHLCGGTLIAPRLVLTAAHCVSTGMATSTGTGYEVLVGEVTLSARTATDGIDVTDVFIHPEFDGHSVYFGFGFGYGGDMDAGSDVAILRLAEAPAGATPTPLVQPGEDTAAWGAGAGRTTGAVALGWGLTASPSSPFAWRRNDRGVDLRSVGLAIRADRRCERSDEGLGLDAGTFDRDTMLCAGTADGPGVTQTAKAVCFGDSGGPLLAPLADGSLRVVGVASWTTSASACRTWSVFARVGDLRSWIESIPQDAGGPGGLLAPTDVRAAGVSPNVLRVRWTPSASGTAMRYRIQRTADLGRLAYFGPSSSGVLFQGGVTGRDGTSIEVEGVEPQRRGQSEIRTIRVDAEDAAGNRVAGALVKVAAPVDAGDPTRPGTPRLHETRRGQVVLHTTASRDADCVERYVVQQQTERGWRSSSAITNQACESLLLGFPHYFGSTSSTAIDLPLRMAAGRHRVRVLAIDRAGNVATSRSSVIELDEAVGLSRRRVNTCFGSGGGLFCATTPISAVTVVAN